MTTLPEAGEIGHLLYRLLWSRIGVVLLGILVLHRLLSVVDPRMAWIFSWMILRSCRLHRDTSGAEEELSRAKGWEVGEDEAEGRENMVSRPLGRRGSPQG